jgi:predicted DNA-binding transcriptional regulator AlpA
MELSKSPVRASVEQFLIRVGFGTSEPSEVAVYPEVLKTYLFNMAEETGESEKGEREESFPCRGANQLVSGAVAAEFLGYTSKTHKRPAVAVIRLANEDKIPKPIKYGDKTLRWNSDDIWAYRDKMEGSA